jgi:DNA-binding SARP family transcriptional activator
VSGAITPIPPTVIEEPSPEAALDSDAADARADEQDRPGPTAPGAGTRTARLQLLDGFVLTWDGEVVELPLGTQRLVAFLAIHGRPLLRTYVAGSLWLEKSDERSQANLRSALWRLRQPAGGLVQTRGVHVRLTPALDVDLHRAVANAQERLGAGTGVPDPDEIDLLMAGDLLPDWYDDWVVLERERLRQLRLNALESSCHRLAAGRQYAAAVEVGLAAVAAEPLRETAHRALIVAHLAEGNRAEALRQFQMYRDLIWQELGVGPSPQLQQALEGWLSAGVELTERWAPQATAR